MPEEILQKILALREELHQHNYNYYVLDEPTVTDFEFDEKYKDEYELLIKEENIYSLPIEYFHFYWKSFALDEKVTPRLFPLKTAFIDSTKTTKNILVIIDILLAFRSKSIFSPKV